MRHQDLIDYICMCRYRLVAALSALVTVLATAAASAAQNTPWGWPLDHELTLNEPNVCTRTTRYEAEDFAWTGASRVLAIQPINSGNYDMIVTDDLGSVRVSQNPDPKAVEFVLFDATQLHQDDRPFVETTVDVYTNGDDSGFYYAYYVEARPVEWDGRNVSLDFSMWYYDLLEARTIYLKAGVAYRFDIDRADGQQAGFVSIMRADPRSRIQTRPQAVAEFGWRGERHDDYVYVPEEGWYTLVLVQENGDAMALGSVEFTQTVPRGSARVASNDIRINISAE
jgi:hypothetical protein